MRTYPSCINVEFYQFIPNVMLLANIPHTHLESVVWMNDYGRTWWPKIGHSKDPLDLGVNHTDEL